MNIDLHIIETHNITGAETLKKITTAKKAGFKYILVVDLNKPRDFTGWSVKELSDRLLMINNALRHHKILKTKSDFLFLEPKAKLHLSIEKEMIESKLSVLIPRNPLRDAGFKRIGDKYFNI